ncbi:TIR domain-containing protein [Rhizobium sp. BK251]|uniref:nSTAND1 domain-containing NTPase n=1 Tax=Rhizobium sp. BK251 TaxID=2512125 RepID=UPI001047BBCA|nr:TIR domain-containing protein [Rhizobium sp. BK251]TCL69447.1 WD domain G-beta repeat uncharacterized protein [Rhizobium sp. BK251]
MSQPCLFLSHSGADTEAARELKRRILDSEAAKAAGLTVWFDKDDLSPGDLWQRELADAISKQATAFAVYVGSRGVVNWVEREVSLGISRATGENAIPFIPILAANAAGSRSLPPFAAQHQGVRDPLNNQQEFTKLLTVIVAGPEKRRFVATDQPFIGLRSMTEDWADRFFGREEEIEQVIALMQRYNLMAIVADSGAGKSSLVQAGLVPRFRGGALEELGGREPDDRIRHVVIMRPGADPLIGLKDGIDAAARVLNLDPEHRRRLRERVDLSQPYETAHAIRCDLDPKKTQSLLYVDQFEELLTLTPEDDRQPFADLLLALADWNFYVLLTVRSDYFNLLSGHDRLWQRLGEDGSGAVYRLRRIGNEGLVQVVSRPLEMAGHTNVDEINALARAFQRDMMDQPGDLALVQMALDAIWRHRQEAGGLLEAYEKVNGIAGALAYEADNVRETKLSAQEQDLLVPLFVRLIRLGDTGGVTRRAARLADLDEARASLARKLTSSDCARLLATTEGESVEPAHEALITQWVWLQNQLGSRETSLAVRRLGSLIDSVTNWVAAPTGEKPKTLANRADYDRYASLRSEHRAWLTDIEDHYIKESGETFLLAETERLRRDRIRAWTTYGSLAAALVLALLSAATGYFYLSSVQQRNDAQRSESLALAGQSLKETEAGDPMAALRLALQALPDDLSNPNRQFAPEALGALRQAVIAASGESDVVLKHKNDVTSIAFSPDGKLLGTTSKDGTIKLWNASTGAQIWEKGSTTAARGVAFSSDGQQIANGSYDRTVQVRDTADGHIISRLIGHTRPITAVKFAPTLPIVATGSYDGTVRLWDSATGEPICTLGSFRQGVLSLDFSPDSSVLAASSYQTVVRFWDIQTKSELAPLPQTQVDAVYAITFSLDGMRLVTASSDGTASVWEYPSRSLLHTLRGHKGGLYSAEFNKDGTQIITSSADRTARIWDIETESELAILTGHHRDVFSAVFSPDGNRAVVGGRSDDARIWALSAPEGQELINRAKELLEQS